METPPPGARRPTKPAGTPPPTDAELDQIRKVRSALEREQHRRDELRQDRLDAATRAWNLHASTSDLVDASGLSRTYLHRQSIIYAPTAAAPLSDEQRRAQNEALHQVRQLRSQIDALTEHIGVLTERRQNLALALLRQGRTQTQVGAAAGLSSEWLRQLTKRSS